MMKYLHYLRIMVFKSFQVNHNMKYVSDINRNENVAPPAVYAGGMIDGPHVVVTKYRNYN